MASNYPGGLDQLATNHQDNVNEAIHAASINDLADAVNKIERELGLEPSFWAVDVQTRLSEMEWPTLSNKLGTTYTLVHTDQHGVIVNASNTDAITLTVPQNTFDLGAQIVVRQGGAGQVTFVAGAGVTLQSRDGAMSIAGRYGYATLICVAANTFDLIGDLV